MEGMSLPLLALSFLALLFAGYAFYGRFLARRLGLDDTRATPAHARADGVDYVATPRFYLFAQHFSAIAAAGPIAGPILACQQFGWLPCLLLLQFHPHDTYYIYHSPFCLRHYNHYK